LPTVAILNGPNLNLLGSSAARGGRHTLAEVEDLCGAAAAELGLGLAFRQSNHEGQLIEWVHQEADAVRAGRSIGAVLNPGALTTTSIALRDAVAGVDLPVVEVHLTNKFGHHSHLSAVARGVVAGLGVHGYVLAIRALHELAARP
jgi:3-dehydroquinate dehydratase-2